MSKFTVLKKHDARERLPDTRYEFKYLLRHDLAERVVRFLEPQLEIDPYSQAEPTRHYAVKSIYWDSPHFECFHNKSSGQRFREKFRLRTYGGNESSPVFLEIKQKSNLDYVKRKVLLSQDQLSAIENRDSNILSDFSEPEHNVMARFFYQIYRKAYVPTSLVVYDRLAFTDLFDHSVRVTFDRHLRSRLFPDLGQLHREDGLENLFGGWVVFEVKFSRLVPRWMGTLNKVFQLKPQACSKYCNSVAHFLGETPDFRKGMRHH